MQETKKYLEDKLGIPGGDRYDLPASEKRFPDGAQYRIEVPTINSPEAMESLLNTAEELSFTINRVDETYGIMRQTDGDLERMISMAKEKKLELNLSVGPRAKYDTSATYHTPLGIYIGYRLRGSDQLMRGIEDVKRGLEFGCRSFLIYDEGMLWVLGEMRKDGKIPAETKFKLSAHCGHGNPASFKVLRNLGADTINPTRDLQLPMISALRQAVDIPIDIHCDNPPGSGGFIRTYESPVIVRIASPVHLKCGNSAVVSHGVPTTPKEAVNMGKQTYLVVQAVRKYYPEAVQSKPGAKGIIVPF